MLAEVGVSNAGYLDPLRDLARELGVANAVTFLDPLAGEDLADLYRTADVAVNAGFYHRENFGLSQAEAQACGLPVVCSDWGGFKDVVGHGETGYLMETVITRHGVRVDWAGGTAYVVRLLRDEGRHQQMGERAARWAREQCAVPRFAARLREILETPEVSPGGDGAAYEPSNFARRYEKHKRARGWYEPAAPTHPMFQGQAYVLYETMMEPYATRLARDLPLSALDPSWIPYVSSTVAVEGHVARDLDPVWPHERRLTPLERELMRRVDGRRTLRRLASDLEVVCGQVVGVIHGFYLDGLILFQGCSSTETYRAL